jgi:hypothetical protein
LVFGFSHPHPHGERKTSSLPTTYVNRPALI